MYFDFGGASWEGQDSQYWIGRVPMSGWKGQVTFIFVAPFTDFSNELDMVSCHSRTVDGIGLQGFLQETNSQWRGCAHRQRRCES